MGVELPPWEVMYSGDALYFSLFVWVCVVRGGVHAYGEEIKFVEASFLYRYY